MISDHFRSEIREEYIYSKNWEKIQKICPYIHTSQEPKKKYVAKRYKTL
jgi:hypothetical protein